jgi:hypothetical protein
MKLDDVDRLVKLRKDHEMASWHLKTFQDMKDNDVDEIIIGFQNPINPGLDSFSIPMSDDVVTFLMGGLRSKILNLEFEMEKFGVEL